MSVSTTYLLNVALHGAVLSIFATGLLVLFRRPGKRSFVAISGLLAVGILPWMTALRPERRVSEPVAEIQAQPVSQALPLWTIVTLPVPEEGSVVENSKSVADAPPFVLPDALTCVLLTWAVGTVAGAILLAGALLKVGFWKRSLRPLDDEVWRILSSLSPGIPGRHLFLLSESTASPCVSGFFRPRIVLPSFLLEKVSEQQLRWAMGHELAHLRAGDSRWMIVFSLIRCVNWWNPFVHVLVSRWAEAREQLCDLHATGIPEDLLDYGKFLVAMARRITGRPPLVVTMAKRAGAGKLKRRITFLLESRADSPKPLGKRFIGLGCALTVAGAALVSGLKIQADVPRETTHVTSGEEAIPEPLPEVLPPAPAVPPASADPIPVKPSPPAAPDMAEAPPANVRIKITSKLFIVTGNHEEFALEITRKPSTGPDWIRSVYSDGQMTLVMKGLSKKPGVELMTAPSVIGKPEEKQLIEIVRGIPGTPEQIARREPGAEVPHVGISLTATPRLSVGGMVDLEQAIDYRFIPGVYEMMALNSGNPLPAGLDPDKIKIVNPTFRGLVPPTMTMCCPVGEVEPGKIMTLLTRVDLVDEAGRKLEPVDGRWVPAAEDGKKQDPDASKLIYDETRRQFHEETNRRKEEGAPHYSKIIPGKLMLTGTLVDLPLESPRPPGDGLVIGLTPSTEETAWKILAAPGAKIRKLKTVEMPLGARRTPWPEFPGLSVSATVSPDFKNITITSHAVGDGVGEFPNEWDDMPRGSTMNFGIRTKDKKIERRLLITIDAKP